MVFLTIKSIITFLRPFLCLKIILPCDAYSMQCLPCVRIALNINLVQPVSISSALDQVVCYLIICASKSVPQSVSFWCYCLYLFGSVTLGHVVLVNIFKVAGRVYCYLFTSCVYNTIVFFCLRIQLYLFQLSPVTYGIRFV